MRPNGIFIAQKLFISLVVLTFFVYLSQNEKVSHKS